MDKNKKVEVDYYDIAMAGSIAIADMPKDIEKAVSMHDAMCMLTAIIAKLLIDNIDCVRAKKEEAMTDGED